MCGIVGAIGERNVAPLLMEGLRRLEYRGYDSAGIAVIDDDARLNRVRTPGKVSRLAALLDAAPVRGRVGIAHTRWATHGAPSERNAHPHLSHHALAVVHNGIIENHEALRRDLAGEGYEFSSDTDTEVVAHLIHRHVSAGRDLGAAVHATAGELVGAYALGVIDEGHPEYVVAVRRGSPLVVGIGVGEHFLASDVAALVPVTRRFIHLEEGDVAELSREELEITDARGVAARRAVATTTLSAEAVDRGPYRHYMHKEIFEQPEAIARTLEGRLGVREVPEALFGTDAAALFDRVERVQIVACGTSCYAGMVARNWFEGLAGVACNVEVASEFRYRHPVANARTLVVSLSQSGETADTLGAVRGARERGFGPSLCIVNAPESALARESDLVLATRAGPEIAVASTKAFTAQLAALLLLVVVLGRRHGLDAAHERRIVEQLRTLPDLCRRVLGLEERVAALAERFIGKEHALFLGRGVQYPVALEGALKMKELSYVHAEAYPAGELKHGPLALVDGSMPVVVVAPNDGLHEKLRSNLEEVRARGGELYVLAEERSGVDPGAGVHVLELPAMGPHVAPIACAIPLQLLAYHTAVLKGTDVDQPRNLAKSVTVE